MGTSKKTTTKKKTAAKKPDTVQTPAIGWIDPMHNRDGRLVVDPKSQQAVYQAKLSVTELERIIKDPRNTYVDSQGVQRVRFPLFSTRSGGWVAKEHRHQEQPKG